MKFRVVLPLVILSVMPFTAFAETAEEQQACMNDAFNVCGHAIPDRNRVAACLYENKSRISSECRAVLNRYQKPASTMTRIKAAAR